MTAPAGSIVGLYVDLKAHVAPDDVVETRSGRRYRVLTVREQTRGLNAGRQHLKASVMAEDDKLPKAAVIHRIRWYRRGPGGGGVTKR